MAGSRKNRNTDAFNMSFLDVICCGFGAVILLLVVTKIYEPVTIEQTKTELKALLQILQQELFDVRGDSVVLDRNLDSLETELATEDDLLATLRAELRQLQGQFGPVGDEENMAQKGELLAARQSLSEDMQRLLRDYRQADDDTTVGGISVDSEYIIFVIDTSGSMFQGPWRLVMQMVSETLQVYPEVKGIQVLNDEGKYMFSSYARRWIPDSSSSRRNIIKRLSSWNPYSDSSPVEGITEAINTFYVPGRKVSLFVFGDDYPRGSVDSVVRYVDGINKGNEVGDRLMRIHAVGFPTQFSRGTSINALRFANLMRTLCERNGGSYVGLTKL
ncbi:MAG: VWA domain-containing protein [Gammaproteobacteria bacterium]|nr:VWA domain-containing protein [Gammaproteobacteria bacterium]MCP4277049.1 VWA domain-containing protein [Gammaproteobacteria bacterium]MCP4929921.1 VWA domain-containing protein [Gammaproteobacteria bacterium]